jgi:hypothetical protein
MPVEGGQSPPEATDPSASLTQLRWSLQSLAMTGSDQQPLFAEHAPGAGALASEFDRCASLVRLEHGADLTAVQTDALAALAGMLATMSRDGTELDADLWTDAAVRTSEQWADVRRLANAALDAFAV